MKNITTFLFLLISVTVTICVLFSLGCGLKPDYAKTYNDQGLAKVEMKQYEGAIADFDTSVERNPDFAEAYYNRGNAKIKLMEFKIANEDYHKAIGLDFFGEMLKLEYDAVTDFKIALKLAEQAGDTQLKSKIAVKLRSLKTPPNGK